MLLFDSSSRRTDLYSTARVAAPLLVLGALGCTQTLDAGSSRPHGLLPVDERNPVVVFNDGIEDNWCLEYALLLANSGGLTLDKIVIGTGGIWQDLNSNVLGARTLVSAARDSGLRQVPDPIASIGALLERPSSGKLDDTKANRSEGALYIVEASKRLALPYRPLVVATGGRLTDVADAYLVDPTVTERVVVVASLGSLSSSGASMGKPNGEMDPWADTIVTSRFRYVQVSAFYDQLSDVPSSQLSQLPANELGNWIAAKQPKIASIPEAADQVAVIAVGIAEFATEVERVAPTGPVESGATVGPVLESHPDAPGWLVRKSNGSLASERFWSILLSPATFAP